jgi:hypothetical protein
MTANPIKKISIAEFRQMGLLHELNRRFLHPLGLALEVEIKADGTEELGGIWDYRDDPSGILYGHLDAEKMKRAQCFIDGQHRHRQETLGYIIQEKDANQDEAGKGAVHAA